MKKVLIIAAHPDDEILGCGGTIARLAKEQNQVFLLILGEGITARDKDRDLLKREKEIQELKQQTVRAGEIIGLTRNFSYDFPDNRFDSVPLLDIVKAIEEIKSEVKPEIVYTHYWGDLNIDHRISYEATLIAFRPNTENEAKQIYSFMVPSSTECSYPNLFNPNIFVDISKTLEAKIKAFSCYTNELRESPHPRSEEALRVLAKHWGSVSGLGLAEAFSAVRIIK